MIAALVCWLFHRPHHVHYQGIRICLLCDPMRPPGVPVAGGLAFGGGLA